MTNLASTNPSEVLKRPKVAIVGVEVDDLTEREAISQILRMAKDHKGRHFVATVNSEFVMLAKKDHTFANILKGSDLSLPDGAGVVVAKLILGGKEKNRVTGADLIGKICEKSAKLPITIGFLGGFSGVAEIVAKRQTAKFPGLNVNFCEAGDPSKDHDLRLRKAILSKKRIDILFVAYGMGQQEHWIQRNRKFLNVGVFIGVGGGFDYEAGARRRAPVLMRKTGTEWLWRLFWQPKRVWRMRVLPVFAFLVIWQFLVQNLAFSRLLAKKSYSQ